MYLEKLTIRNFQSFGPDPTTLTFSRRLTTFLGANAAGKTAACQALLRLFSVVAEQRQVRAEDFHVPHDETPATAPTSRTLTVEAVFAFPELNSSGAGDPTAALSVPEFFAQMTADADDGVLKLRIVLEATWVDDGSVNGTVEVSRRVVYTAEEKYDDKWVELRGADRNRIQMVYVPATRDGVRQVSAFLRGRVWSAALWSDNFREHVDIAASDLVAEFQQEEVVQTVTDAITSRWQGLHHLGLDQNPNLQPMSGDIGELVTGAAMFFEPSVTGRPRPARELSDGQQSLLHIALTAAALDLEAEIAAGTHDDKFDMSSATLPTLTLLALEEPENNLAPFYLSRVVQQLIDVAGSGRAQALISSHSASVMSRIKPERVRYFRLDPATRTTTVRRIALPPKASDEGKYVREAVRAHPELYFARFVVLGEGDSEELVIPRLASARGLHIDQSFVAMVPLGGRHTNHFWKLLRQLDIPHATLLDLDYGRDGGGEGRIKNVCDQLEDLGIDPYAGIAGYDSAPDLKDLNRSQIKVWLKHLEQWDVFFSIPLDLDWSLLAAFEKAYTTNLGAGAKGPQSTDARDAVLGDKKALPAAEYWKDPRFDELFRWYRYLFLTNSKPSTHLRAMTQLSDGELANPPKPLGPLLDRIADALGHS
ncbi:AAA family ATPase [Nocardioides sp. BGMRC 2183]|nr:AAA family ATPase [Nocardioides sp. BGMRC 2183]